MLNNKLIEDTMKDAITELLEKRYPKFERPILVEYCTVSDMVKITTSLPNGNWVIKSLSLRGYDYLYQWIAKLVTTYPVLDRMFRGHDPKCEYATDIDWTAI